MIEFDIGILDRNDRFLALELLETPPIPGIPFRLLHPDVVLAPDGEPYLYRWHLRYDNLRGNAFLHVQVKSDPERPFHDHPWNNTSIILAGGYDEHYQPHPSEEDGTVFWEQRQLRKWDRAERPAETSHRLFLPHGIPYAMTLFCTGPKVREWGFWYPHCDWHHSQRHVDDRDPRGSVHVKKEG